MYGVVPFNSVCTISRVKFLNKIFTYLHFQCHVPGGPSITGCAGVRFPVNEGWNCSMAHISDCVRVCEFCNVVVHLVC